MVARPNAGHLAVARLAKKGKVGMVITQNVDNLHQDSGVPDDRVIELHGNAGYAKCLRLRPSGTRLAELEGARFWSMGSYRLAAPAAPS